MDERAHLWEAFDLAGRRLQEANSKLAEAERVYGEAARALDAYDNQRSADSASESQK